MELEDLRRRWEEQDTKLDACIRLNRGLLRDSILGKTETALRRLFRLLVAGLLVNTIAALWLGSFLADHLTAVRFLVPATALLLGVIALVIADIRQMVALREVDYSAPVIAIQRRLESLRVERIRATRWTFILAPLAWTPALIVVIRGFLGVDAYMFFDARWLAANLLFGLLVIVVSVWASRRYADRMARSPFVQSIMRDIAGQSLTAASGFLSSLSDLEEEGTRA